MRLPRIRLGTALILTTLVVAWAYLFVSSERRNPIKWWQVGCYQGSQQFKDIELHITHDGALTFPGAAVPVHLYNDKVGDSFDPDRRIVLDRSKHALTVTPGYPDLLRINPDGSFYIPDDGDEVIPFVRCVGA